MSALTNSQENIVESTNDVSLSSVCFDNSFDVNKPFTIAMFEGGSVNIRAKIGDMSFIELADYCGKCQEGGKHDNYFTRGVPAFEEVYVSKKGNEYTKGRFRHDSSISHASFLIGDIDKSKCTPKEVHAALKCLNLIHFIYTSHSHKYKSEDNNNFRIVMPCYISRKDYMVATAIELINKLKDEGCDVEYVDEMGKWSQPWYLPTRTNPNDGVFEFYCSMKGDAFNEVQRIESNPKKIINSKDKSNTDLKSGNLSDSKLEILKDDWCEIIISGENFHATIRDNTVKLARKKLSKLQILILMQGLMKRGKERDERWQERYDNIENLVETAFSTLETPQALPFFEGAKKEPPMDCLPQILRDAVENCATHNEVPKVMAFGAGLGACSIAIGNSVAITELEGLIHFLSLHIVCIGGTGERKSPTYKYFMSNIHEFQKILEDKFVKIKSEYNLEKEVDEEAKKAMLKLIAKDAVKQEPTTNPIYKEAIIKINKKLNKYDGMKIPRLIISNATEEEAIIACYENNHFIGIGSPDGKSAINLIEGKYRNGNDDGAGFIVNSAVGDPVDYHRRGFDVPISMANPASAMLLMIQGKVAKHFRKNESLIDLGLFARLVFLAGSSFIGKRSWGKNELDKDIQNKIHDWLNKILESRTHIDNRGNKNKVRMLELSEEAQDLQRLFFLSIEKRMIDDPKSIEFINKAPSMAVKIAGIFHLLNEVSLFSNLSNTSNVVCGDVMSDAIEVTKYLIDVHLNVVFQSETEIIFDHSRSLLHWLIKSDLRFDDYEKDGFIISDIKELTKRDFHSTLGHGLMGLVSKKWITKKKNKGGVRYFINFSIDEAEYELSRKPEYD